jgi:hypothetical protein
MRDIKSYTDQLDKNNSILLINTTLDTIIDTINSYFCSLSIDKFIHINKQLIKINDYIILNTDLDVQNDINSPIYIIAIEETKDFGLCAKIVTTRWIDNIQYIDIINWINKDRKKIAHYIIFVDRFIRLIDVIYKKFCTHVSKSTNINVYEDYIDYRDHVLCVFIDVVKYLVIEIKYNILTRNYVIHIVEENSIEYYTDKISINEIYQTLLLNKELIIQMVKDGIIDPYILMKLIAYEL